MNHCRWAMGVVLALMLVASGPATPAADDKPADGDETVFKMQEVSIFDQKEGTDDLRYSMFGRTQAMCDTRPAPEVKAYPKLNSKQPLYGSILLNRDPEAPGTPGVKYYFVLDESEAAIKAAAKEAEDAAVKPADTPDDQPFEKPAKKSSKTKAKKDATKQKDVAAKKPAAKSKQIAKHHYDLLYFDLNHDLDLTNDPAVALMKDPPASLARLGIDPQNSRVFETIAVPLGGDAKATIRVLPVLMAYADRGIMTLLAASGWKGEIKLGKQAYKAVLGQPGGMITRFDRPSTPLILTPVSGVKQQRSLFGLDTLGMLREADGEYYTITATPTGNQLTVKPYRGDCGVFEVSAAGRDIKDVGMAGVLRSKDSILPLGKLPFPVATERAQQAKFKIPVGDYQPMLLSVDYGPLTVSLRQDYTRAAGPAKTAPFNIAIRKDQPYVLDFKGKAALNFLSPAKDKTFKPGNDVRLAAMLSDPDKGLLITGLEDTTKKIGEMKWAGEDGKPITVPRYASLEPEVAITDSSGKKVAGGKMPFG